VGKRDITIRLNQVRALMEIGAVQFNYEGILENHYRRWVKAGDTVMDIGAHVGRHLLPLAQCVGDFGTAIGFEPLPFAFKILQEKFAGTKTILVNSAMSNKVGIASFTHARGTPEESGLRQREYNIPEQADPTIIEVKVDTLDHYAEKLASLSFLKIDIEGGEIDCLRGGAKTLARLRPVVSVEFGFAAYSAYGHEKDALFNFAKTHDFILYDIFLNRLKTRREWLTACDTVYWDYLMVPSEKEADFIARVCPPKIAAPKPAWTVGRVARGIARRVRPVFNRRPEA
jgi:FkbM family methyltransferase